MPETSSLEDCIAALKKLNRKIRKPHPSEPWNGIAAFDETIRGLTSSEWAIVEEAVRQYELPCLIVSGLYGFALCIHANGGMPGIKPNALLIIEDGQFPFPSAQKGFSGQGETLHRLSPITHNQRNKELLARYGFEPLMYPPEQYAY